MISLSLYIYIYIVAPIAGRPGAGGDASEGAPEGRDVRKQICSNSYEFS